MVTEDSFCPLCSQQGKVSRIITVFYTCEDALYTCEDKKCIYFLSNTDGNLVKFSKKHNETSFILDTTYENNELLDVNDHVKDDLDLDGIINSIQQGQKISSTAINSNTQQNSIENNSLKRKSENNYNDLYCDSYNINFDEFLLS